MNARFYIVFLFTALWCNCFAQKEDGYIAFSVGGGLPTSHFGSADIRDSSSGFARPGINFSLSLAYKISKKIGVCGLIRNQSNSLDVDAFVSQFEKKYPGVKWTMQAKDWNIKLFMAGLYYSAPLGDSTFFIDLKGMIGIASATLPGYTITGTQNGNSLSATQNSATSGAPCFAVGIGFKKYLNEAFCLIGGIDYMSTRPSFTGVLVSFSNGTTQTVSGSQSITSVAITLGVGFRL